MIVHMEGLMVLQIMSNPSPPASKVLANNWQWPKGNERRPHEESRYHQACR